MPNLEEILEKEYYETSPSYDENNLTYNLAPRKLMEYLEWVPDCWGEESYPRYVQNMKR